MKKEFLECGRVCNSHGVRGIIKVEPWCDSPRVLANSKKVYMEEHGAYREYKVVAGSVNGNNVLLTLEGVNSCEMAIALKGKVLFLHRSDIPLKPGSMLLQDMIGLSVIDYNTGKVYGEIESIDEVPRGRLYTVRTPNGLVYYPHEDVFVKEIDAERGMFITPIPGFFDGADEI